MVPTLLAVKALSRLVEGRPQSTLEQGDDKVAEELRAVLEGEPPKQSDGDQAPASGRRDSR